MLIDTHCHMHIMVRNFEAKNEFQPFLPQEIDEFKKIIADAKNNQVTTIINVGTNLVESVACIKLAELFQNCFATLGIHPNDIEDNWQLVIKKFDQLLDEKQQNKIIGIGECGIDKHYPNYNLLQQEEAFHAQIQLAIKHDVPLVIHSRDADDETYNVLAQYHGESNFRGTIHCFSSNEIFAQKYLDLGFVLGFGGTLTYPKNNTLRIIAQTIPLSSIILETDAPFLPPQPLRGQKNYPAYIKMIAEYLAQLRQESFEHVMQTTSQTTRKLFGIIAD